MDCQVTLAQTNPRLGDVATNLEAHKRCIAQAIEAGSQIVLFPELSLTGYFLKDQTPEVAMRPDARVLSELLSLSTEISIGVGFVERAPDGRVFNSTAFLEDGKILRVHRKVHLVTYGMFDEERDFAAGNEFLAFDSKHGRFGFLICEDLWHASSAYQLFLDNVDAMFVVSCGPGRGIEGASGEFTSVSTWRTLLAAHALFCQTWMCYVNRVGWEDGVMFSGSSRVVDPFGQDAASLGALEEGLLHVRLRSRENERARIATPLRRDAKPWLLLDGLERWSKRGGRL